MRKVYATADEALAGQIKDGMILMVGGFRGLWSSRDADRRRTQVRREGFDVRFQ